ncbi:MAG TPA: GNAT family N-acetyltransferase [Deltaproteobacteria bacterium]|nr:GNAT family N-acetyltransferase [Deltaproteobacteria bacterium]
MIRKAQKSDAAMIHHMHVSSIRDLCGNTYTDGQILAWTKGLAPERYAQGMDDLEFYVEEGQDGSLSGLLIFNRESGEVCALYVAPWVVRKGTGRRFMALAEDAVRGNGHAEMSLKSTLNAVTFYERLGFERRGDSVHGLLGGETLPCVQMTKRLD